MTTIHAGDRTSGCDTCSDNDYLNEITTNYPNYDEGAILAFANNGSYKLAEYEDWISDFEEAYQGEMSTEDFASQLADELYLSDNSIPNWVTIYFDYEKFERDLFMGDYWESNGFIFRSV